MSILFLPPLLGILFLTVVFLHFTKKNIATVTAYGIQSVVITLILLHSFFESYSFFLLFVVLTMLVVKVILTPIFFIQLIRRHELTFSATTYLNTPLTLLVLAAFTALAHSQKFYSLTSIIPDNHSWLSLALSALFISLFLVINRKGALSQAIGILSLENSLVAFAIFAGLEQSPVLQIGILFDIFLWIVIATVFISMIYRHFGSLDTSLMKTLKE